MERGDQRRTCLVPCPGRQMTGEANPAILGLGKRRTVGMSTYSGTLGVGQFTAAMALEAGHCRHGSTAGAHDMAEGAVPAGGLHSGVMPILIFSNAARDNLL